MNLNFPKLKTERLFLNEVTEKHAEQLIEIAAFKIPNAAKKDALNLIDKLGETYNNGKGITWGIYLNSDLIGTVGYYRGFDNQVGEIGYVMREAFKRNGYMEEAMIAAIQYGFDELKLKCIQAYTAHTNTASVSLLLKLGFVKSSTENTDYVIFEKTG